MRVLVVNTGSSSLKLSVVDETGPVESTVVERWEGLGHLEPIESFLASVGQVDAIGHRVVHGGPRHTSAARVDDDLLRYLESISDLAPLHNPRAVAGARELGRLLPDTPAVAAFDTSFHATIPPEAATYALPREWNRRWQLRRYGFHGLSHSYAVRRAAEIVGEPVESLRIVSCHLGAGSSLAAVRRGISVDTTMGFTPLAGLVMQTRSGSVDPGLLLWLLQHGGQDVDSLASTLDHEAGLKGLSGTSGDLRDVLAGRAAGDGDCALAFDVFAHRLVREAAAMAAACGGLDVLVMTGGIGEHSAEVREAAAVGLAHLGVAVDDAANKAGVDDRDISTAVAPARTVVLAAGEDRQVALETQHLLG
jgi:acetate kinase